MVYVNTLCIAVYTEKIYSIYSLHFFPSHRIKCEVSKPKSPRFYLGWKSLPILPNGFLDKTASNDSVELNDHEDLLSDDLGACFQIKTRKKWYKARCDKGGKVEKVFKVWDDSDGFLVCRRPFVNASDSSLHKTIVDVAHRDGRHPNIVLVKYEFVGAPEDEVKVKHHGNAKSCSIPYLRNFKSKLKTLQKEAKALTELFVR